MLSNKKLENIIDTAPNPIISSIDCEGFPVSRMMLAVRYREGLDNIYFSTNTSSNKVSEFINNNKASIYFFDTFKFTGCLFKGTMEVCNDMESKLKVWQSGDELYYPKGIEDEDFTVLKFKPIKARVYENFKSEDITI